MELVTFAARMNKKEFGSYITLVLSSSVLSLHLGGHCLSLILPLGNVWFLTGRETPRGSRLRVGLATVGADIFLLCMVQRTPMSDLEYYGYVLQ